MNVLNNNSDDDDDENVISSKLWRLHFGENNKQTRTSKVFDIETIQYLILGNLILNLLNLE